MTRSKDIPIYVALILSMAVMSISAPLNKLAMALGMPPAVINFWRLGTASLCTLPFVLFTTRGRADIRLLLSSRRDMLLMAVSGIFLAMHFYTWVLSLSITSLFGSVVLSSAHTAFTMAGDRVFFGQRYSKSGMLGAAVSLLGIVVVGLNSILRHEGNILGDLLSLLGAVMFSGYMLCGRELRARYAINTYTTGVYGMSAAVLAAVSVASGLRFAPYPPMAFAYVGCIVVASTFLGHTIVNWSLGHLPPSTVSILLLASPMMAGMWSFALLGDRPSGFLIAGGLITVLGMAWYIFAQVQAAKRVPVQPVSSIS